MTFGSKLRSARKAKQLTQKELAAKIKAAHNSISNWENDQNMPDPDTIQNLCWALNVQPNYFFDVETLPRNLLPMPETSRVPRIGRIACGEPITAEENVEGYDEVLASWRADFTLICCGDSMLPKIEDGDVVAIRQQPTVENGEIAAVRIGDEATLKQVFVHSDFVELRPLNSNFESIIKKKEEMGDIHIEGKAVGLCRNL